MINVIRGDCRTALSNLTDVPNVHACITSPPYFGQRSYMPDDSPFKHLEIGTERTVDQYVTHICEAMDAVRAVLRHDSTLWLNLGDTMRDSQMLGVPWRVAFALQDRGWFLRAHLPWIKRNPKPESVDNRPSNAMEWVFLFSTSKSNYFYDGEAIRQPGSMASVERYGRAMGNHKNVNGAPGQPPDTMLQPRPNTNKRRGYPRQDEGTLDSTTREQQCAGTRNARNTDWFFASFQGLLNDEGHPLALVVNPVGYSGAHTATFPPKLVEPMILASTSGVGCCPSCFTQFERQIEKGDPVIEQQRACGGDSNGLYAGQNTKDYAEAKAEGASELKARILAGMRERRTIGWTHPDNGCRFHGTYVPDHEVIRNAIPSTVIDPFGGSGTVGEVATALGRNAILCELDPKCLPMIDRRAQTTPGLKLA